MRRLRAYYAAHPGTAALVAEVADLLPPRPD